MFLDRYLNLNNTKNKSTAAKPVKYSPTLNPNTETPNIDLPLTSIINIRTNEKFKINIMLLFLINENSLYVSFNFS